MGRVGRATVIVTLQMRRSWNIARRVDVGRHVWIYGTARPEDGRTCFYTLIRRPLCRFTRLYASAGCVVTPCLSVCLPVRLSQVGVVPKRLIVWPRKQGCTIASRL